MIFCWWSPEKPTSHQAWQPRMWIVYYDNFFFIAGNGVCVKLEFHKNYNGTSSRTLNGLTCQRWDSQDPHKHRYNDSNLFSEDTLKNVENFCRTPDGSDWPWCFTTDSGVRSQPCDFDVKLCGGGITSGTNHVKPNCNIYNVYRFK